MSFTIGRSSTERRVSAGRGSSLLALSGLVALVHHSSSASRSRRPLRSTAAALLMDKESTPGGIEMRSARVPCTSRTASETPACSLPSTQHQRSACQTPNRTQVPLRVSTHKGACVCALRAGHQLWQSDTLFCTRGQYSGRRGKQQKCAFGVPRWSSSRVARRRRRSRQRSTAHGASQRVAPKPAHRHVMLA